MREMRLSRTALGKKILARVTLLDEGINVLLVGGDKTHIGAVSRRAADGEACDLCFPGHREGVICEKWAREIFEKTGAPAAVECGIHYDGIDARGIEDVLAACDAMLEELLERVKGI